MGLGSGTLRVSAVRFLVGLDGGASRKGAGGLTLWPGGKSSNTCSIVGNMNIRFFIFGYLFIEGGVLEDASCERDSGEEIGGHGSRYQAVVMGVSEEWERGDGGGVGLES